MLLDCGSVPRVGVCVNPSFHFNEAEVDVLLDLLCFLHDPVNVGNLISGFSASSKPSLYIWKFLFQVSPKKDIDFCFVLSLFFFFFYWL